VIVVQAILREHPRAQRPERPSPPSATLLGKSKLEMPEMRGDELDGRHFTKILELIRPRNDEAHVEQVPWINFLWEARLKAAAEGKPIFIWSAGGPPGTC
jgi:hypothetical protein